MAGRIVECLTRARRAGERLAPVERTALAALATAWAAGVVIRGLDGDAALVRHLAALLDPPLPAVEELAARLPPGDPRVAWYAAGLALKEELARADSAPAPIDPNAADRADWDRLPGVGPKTALAILDHRARHGTFRSPDDLLAVHGIGPKKLARLVPWLAWPEEETAGGSAVAGGLPDLNRVDEDFLAGLPNIGPHLAERIVLERRKRRGFRDWSDVIAVEGIGPSRMRILQNATRLAGHPPATVEERTP